MAHTVYTADDVAKVAATIVGKDLNLAALVAQDIAADFTPGGGGNVRVRVPGAVPAHKRAIRSNTTLERGEVDEQTILVSLDNEVYSQVALPRGVEDLDLQSFASQILRPQAHAVAADVERTVAAAMAATPLAEGFAYDPAAPAKAFTAARRTLRTRGVTADTPIIAACGAGIYADLLDADAVDDHDKCRGIQVVESTRIAETEAVFFVKNAFVLAVRAPIAPDGAPYAATVREGGFALSYVRAFDPTVGCDTSLVSTFVGCRPMPLAVDAEDGTVTLVENGGALRVAAA